MHNSFITRSSRLHITIENQVPLFAQADKQIVSRGRFYGHRVQPPPSPLMVESGSRDLSRHLFIIIPSKTATHAHVQLSVPPTHPSSSHVLQFSGEPDFNYIIKDTSPAVIIIRVIICLQLRRARRFRYLRHPPPPIPHHHRLVLSYWRNPRYLFRTKNADEFSNYCHISQCEEPVYLFRTKTAY